MEENMDAELQKKLTVDDQPPAPQRELGTVIFASYVKGYGFIWRRVLGRMFGFTSRT